jgi:hypothetical protein
MLARLFFFAFAKMAFHAWRERLALLPAFQLADVRCVEPAGEKIVALLFEFSTDKFHHLTGGGEIVSEGALVVAVAAILRAPAAILVGATLARILLQRHTTALAKPVKSSHDSLF